MSDIVEESMRTHWSAIEAAVAKGLEAGPDLGSLVQVVPSADPLPYRATEVRWKPWPDARIGLEQVEVSFDRAWRVTCEHELLLADFDAVAAERLRAVTQFARAARSLERRAVLALACRLADTYEFTVRGVESAAAAIESGLQQGAADPSELRLIAVKGDVAEEAAKKGLVDEVVEAPAELAPGLGGLLVRSSGGPHVSRVHDLTLTWARQPTALPPRLAAGRAEAFLHICGTFFVDFSGRVAALVK